MVKGPKARAQEKAMSTFKSWRKVLRVRRIPERLFPSLDLIDRVLSSNGKEGLVDLRRLVASDEARYTGYVKDYLTRRTAAFAKLGIRLTPVSSFRFHPACLAFPQMPEDELDELAKSIKEKGQVVPVVRWKAKDLIVDGRNRVFACERAGLDPKVYDRNFADDAAVWSFVCAMNAERRHLTREQRDQIIKEHLKATPSVSDRKIAGEVKVDHKTVAKKRREMESGGEIPHLTKREDARGRKQAARKTKQTPTRPSPARASQMKADRHDEEPDPPQPQYASIVDDLKKIGLRIVTERRKTKMSSLSGSCLLSAVWTVEGTIRGSLK
jgi:ParB-like chromosome segregation protein Spo0J